MVKNVKTDISEPKHISDTSTALRKHPEKRNPASKEKQTEKSTLQ